MNGSPAGYEASPVGSAGVERRQPWRVRSTMGLWLLALVYGLLIVGATIVVSNVRHVHRLGLEITRLSAEVTDLTLRQTALRSEMQNRVDKLEKTLFGDVLTKLEQPAAESKPTRLERWQVNRDRDIRDRILQLEAWRFRVER